MRDMHSYHCIGIDLIRWNISLISINSSNTATNILQLQKISWVENNQIHSIFFSDCHIRVPFTWLLDSMLYCDQVVNSENNQIFANIWEMLFRTLNWNKIFLINLQSVISSKCFIIINIIIFICLFVCFSATGTIWKHYGYCRVNLESLL